MELEITSRLHRATDWSSSWDGGVIFAPNYLCRSASPALTIDPFCAFYPFSLVPRVGHRLRYLISAKGKLEKAFSLIINIEILTRRNDYKSCALYDHTQRERGLWANVLIWYLAELGESWLDDYLSA